MSPPIRASGHDKALQAALSTGNLQLVGTDHCAFNSTQKAFGINDFRTIPNGVNGIEERMHLVWDTMVGFGQVSIIDYVRKTSTECARVFNMYPRKGAILAGSASLRSKAGAVATFQARLGTRLMVKQFWSWDVKLMFRWPSSASTTFVHPPAHPGASSPLQLRTAWAQFQWGKPASSLQSLLSTTQMHWTLVSLWLMKLRHQFRYGRRRCMQMERFGRRTLSFWREDQSLVVLGCSREVHAVQEK